MVNSLKPRGRGRHWTRGHTRQISSSSTTCVQWPRGLSRRPCATASRRAQRPLGIVTARAMERRFDQRPPQRRRAALGDRAGPRMARTALDAGHQPRHSWRVAAPWRSASMSAYSAAHRHADHGAECQAIVVSARTIGSSAAAACATAGICCPCVSLEDELEDALNPPHGGLALRGQRPPAESHANPRAARQSLPRLANAMPQQRRAQALDQRLSASLHQHMLARYLQLPQLANRQRRTIDADDAVALPSIGEAPRIEAVRLRRLGPPSSACATVFDHLNRCQPPVPPRRRNAMSVLLFRRRWHCSEGIAQNAAIPRLPRSNLASQRRRAIPAPFTTA